MNLLIGVLSGFAVAMLVVFFRPTLVSTWYAHNRFVRRTVSRFTAEDVNTGGYVVGYYAGASVTFFLFVITLPLVPAILVWAVVLSVPFVLISRAWTARREKIEENLPEAIRQLSSQVASGLSLRRAIERLSERAPKPLDLEFKVIKKSIDFGSELDTALDMATKRVDLPDFALFTAALKVNRRMGGNITSTLTELSDSLDAVAAMRGEVRAATSEGRMNLWFLGLAPFLMLGFSLITDAEAVGMLFTQPMGQAMVAGASALIAIGFVWAWSIVNADV